MRQKPKRILLLTDNYTIIIEFPNRLCCVCFNQNEEITGDEVKELTENVVVECQQGDTISVQSATDNCALVSFEQARGLVFMLQAIP